MKKSWIVSSVAAAALASSLLTALSPVQASFAGQNGLIAYEAYSNFQSDIYVVNKDGSFATNITRSAEQVELAPAFSADGTRIAFQRSGTDFSDGDIWTMAVDGSGQVPITDTPKADESYPTFHPDGTQVAYLRYDHTSFKTDLWVSGVDGTGDRALTTSGDIGYGHISWSPDGSKIVHARSPRSADGNSAIFVTDVVSGVSTRLTPLTDYEFDPDYSPDGTRIVFTHSPQQGFLEHRLMNPDGTNVTVLVTDDDDTFTYGAVWAPDGSGVLVSASKDERPVVGFIDVNTRAFTELMVQDGFTIAWQPCGSDCPTLSSPSPVAIEISAYNTRRATHASIKVVPLHPGDLVQVTYLRKTSGNFKEVTSKPVTVRPNGFGSVKLRLFKTGRCKIKASFAGDEDHTAGRARVASRCNRFASGGE